MTTYKCTIHNTTFGADAPAELVKCPFCVDEELRTLRKAYSQKHDEVQTLIGAINIAKTYQVVEPLTNRKD